MLTSNENLILELLAKCPNGAFGSDLLKLSNGRLSRGSVYALLSRLANGEFVSDEEIPPVDDESLPRTKYSITHKGRAARIEFDHSERPVGLSNARVQIP